MKNLLKTFAKEIWLSTFINNVFSFPEFSKNFTQLSNRITQKFQRYLSLIFSNKNSFSILSTPLLLLLLNKYLV